nr:PREDICTED: uncharacterized protein LOC106493822 [Apteryx mantelli mantelli]
MRGPESVALLLSHGLPLLLQFEPSDNLTATQLACLFFGPALLQDIVVAETLALSLQSPPASHASAPLADLLAAASQQALASLTDAQAWGATLGAIFPTLRGLFATSALQQQRMRSNTQQEQGVGHRWSAESIRTNHLPSGSKQLSLNLIPLNPEHCRLPETPARANLRLPARRTSAGLRARRGRECSPLRSSPRSFVSAGSQAYISLLPTDLQGTWSALLTFLESQHAATGSPRACDHQRNLDWLQENLWAFAAVAHCEDFIALLADFSGFEPSDNLTATQLACLFFGPALLQDIVVAETLALSLQSPPASHASAPLADLLAAASQVRY